THTHTHTLTHARTHTHTHTQTHTHYDCQRATGFVSFHRHTLCALSLSDTQTECVTESNRAVNIPDSRVECTHTHTHTHTQTYTHTHTHTSCEVYSHVKSDRLVYLLPRIFCPHKKNARAAFLP